MDSKKKLNMLISNVNKYYCTSSYKSSIDESHYEYIGAPKRCRLLIYRDRYCVFGIFLRDNLEECITAANEYLLTSTKARKKIIKEDLFYKECRLKDMINIESNIINNTQINGNI